MAFFPQINANLILTQLPYTTSQVFESVAQDLESGMRWTFPRRAAGITGYPNSSLMQFQVSFPNITDAEVDSLYTFFKSMRGQWGKFSFLDPGGNLLQYSEDFSQSYWDKSSGSVVVTPNATDMFGHTRASGLSGGGGSDLQAVVGPATGGMSGFVMCASVWVKSSTAITVTIGFSFGSSTSWLLPAGGWLRIHHTAVVPNNSSFKAQLSWGGSAITIFGYQVAPMKGEGAYVQSPDNYGYHANCRFATDSFNRDAQGPNQNSVALPINEYFVLP